MSGEIKIRLTELVKFADPFLEARRPHRITVATELRVDPQKDITILNHIYLLSGVTLLMRGHGRGDAHHQSSHRVRPNLTSEADLL